MDSIPHTDDVPSEGTVREWSDDAGWGVIDSADTPGGCWAHFSMIVAQGYRSLRAGERVTFTYEAPGQDGFDYRARSVWPRDGGPEAPPAPAQDDLSAAYQSSLTIRWQHGRVTRAMPDRGEDN
jgi:CspA family cold shock protein